VSSKKLLRHHFLAPATLTVALCADGLPTARVKATSFHLREVDVPFQPNLARIRQQPQ
jgi:hypothetical protein